MNYKKLNIEVIGLEDQLTELAMFLRKLEFLGEIGATRTLHLWYDGDGAARLKVNFPDLKEKVAVKGTIGGKDETWDKEENYKFYIE